MTAETLRRTFTEAELDRMIGAEDAEATVEALRGVLDRLADQHFFEATTEERLQAAFLATALMSAETKETGAEDALRLARGEWHEKAAAAEERLRQNDWTPAHLLGRIVSGFTFKKKKRAGLDTAASQALIVALREVLMPDADLLQTTTGHARALGFSRQAAALRALTAATVLTGEALCSEEDHRDVALALGAAASVCVKTTSTEEKKETKALRALVEAVVDENAARLELHDGCETEDARLLGAAGLAAATGRGGLGIPASQREGGSSVSFRLPEAWHLRFSHVAAADAAEALAEYALDPRISDAERMMADALVETLRACPAADHISFSEALGIEPAEIRTDGFRPGRPLYRAALRGTLPTAIICAGKRGRRLRCRAVADHDGAVVGYRAFDLLSRELGGSPLYALYDLSGRRYGYAWTDGTTIVRMGVPAQGFKTAPETIPL